MGIGKRRTGHEQAYMLSEVAWIKWTWFLVPCVALLAVCYVMWVPLLEGNRHETATV